MLERPHVEEFVIVIFFSRILFSLSIVNCQWNSIQLTMHVVPEGPIENNTMLVYLAASYNPNEKGYLSVGIVEDKVAYVYSNAAGLQIIFHLYSSQ